MRNVIIVNKQIGETPLQCLERVRLEQNIPKDIPMTYAGRLDPMAEGLMIILIDAECKNKEKYTNLPKKYEVEILLGIETDSYDILGLIKKVNKENFSSFKKVDEIDLKIYKRKFLQKYPRYSSKIIAMKEIPEEMPSREVEIFSIRRLKVKAISGEEIIEKVLEKLKKVDGDFRQKEIIEKWQNFAKKHEKNKFKLIKIKVECSSGTYMRSLAHEMGGLAFSIKRNRVGNFKI